MIWTRRVAVPAVLGLTLLMWEALHGEPEQGRQSRNPDDASNTEPARSLQASSPPIETLGVAKDTGAVVPTAGANRTLDDPVWSRALAQRVTDDASQARQVEGGLAYIHGARGAALLWGDGGSVELKARRHTPVDARPLTMGAARVDGIAVDTTSPRSSHCVPGDERKDARGDCLHRMSATAGGVTSWWDTTTRGFRQGWTIQAPHDDDGVLRIEVPVDQPVDVVDRSVRVGEKGTGWFADGLAAWDAAGERLALTVEATRTGFALVVDVAGAVWPVTVDPYWNGWGWGIPAQQLLGFEEALVDFAAAGDVNGDGHPDLWAGYPSYEDGAGAGWVDLYLGDGEGFETEPHQTLLGAAHDEEFGRTMASGDVDGDGHLDLIIGIPKRDHGGLDDRGAVEVHLGTADGPDATVDLTLYGSAAGGRFGTALDLVDVDGDGYDDLIVGEPETAGGKVLLYEGSSTGLASVASDTWTGASGGRFGVSLCVGDVNGDDEPDLVVGEPQADNASPSLVAAGRVRVFDGDGSGFASTEWVELWGAQAEETLGLAVRCVGDMDADGDDELVLQRAGEDGFDLYTGGTTDVTFSRTLGGRAVHGAGDMDGDGRDDVVQGGASEGWPSDDPDGDFPLVSEPDTLWMSWARAWSWEAGASQVTAAAKHGMGTFVDTMDPLARSVAALGDVDGDGYDDVMMSQFGTGSLWFGSAGMAEGPTGQAVEGALRSAPRLMLYIEEPTSLVYDPSCGCHVEVFEDWFAPGPDVYGRHVTSKGDFDGDGFDDLALIRYVEDWYGKVDAQLHIHEGSDEGLASSESLSVDLGQTHYTDYPLTRSSVSSDTVSLEEMGSPSVVYGGDLNGDGMDELLSIEPLPGVDTFGLVIRFGQDTWDEEPTLEERDTPSTGFDDEEWRPGPIGDINGDGYEDMAVSAYVPLRALAGQGTRRGRLRTFLGEADGVGEEHETLLGAAGNATFGTTFAAAGDVDGDGYGDLLVGSPGATAATAGSPGRVDLYLGSSTGDLLTPPDQTWWGTVDGGEFGFELTADADINGDGHRDLVIGAPGHVHDVGSGRIHVVLGTSQGFETTVHQTFDSIGYGEGFGHQLVGLGDVDNDGYDDVLVGQPEGGFHNSTRAVVLSGSSTGLVDGTHWRAGARALPIASWNAMSGGGDHNGDGYPELVMGSGRTYEYGSSSWVAVHYGASAGLTPWVPALGMVVSFIGETEGVQGQALDLEVSVIADDEATLDHAWDFGDGTTSSDGAAVSHTWDAPGRYWVTVTVADDLGGSVERGHWVQVKDLPIVMQPVTEVTATEGVLYEADVDWTYGGEAELQAVLRNGPEGAGIDATTGEITWTPSFEDITVPGVFFEVEVSNGGDHWERTSWLVEVAFADEDADGLADTWETLHGLDTTIDDGALDDDLDGRTNLQEFQDGTDPGVYEGPGVPALTAPAAGAEVDSLSPVLEWTPAAHPLGEPQTYDVQIHADENLTTLLVEVEDVEGTSWSVDPALSEDAWVWWRARAVDAHAASAWSEPSSFRLNATESPPTDPVPIWPVDGEVMASEPPVLQWATSTDVDDDVVTYELRLLDESENIVEEGSAGVSEQAVATWTPSEMLAEDARYTWRVRAVDEHGMSSTWTSRQTFVYSLVDLAPEGLVLTEPVDGDDWLPVSPTFEVAAAVDPEGFGVTHTLQLDTVVTFDGADLRTVTLPEATDGTITWSPEDDGFTLTDRQDWHVRVQATDEGGLTGPWEAASFRVGGPDLPPEVPEWLSPSADAPVDRREPVTLTVSVPEDADGDEVLVTVGLFSDVGLTDAVVLEEGLSGEGTVDVTAEIPKGFRTLYASAQAVDATGKESGWAEPVALEVNGAGIAAGCSTVPGAVGGLGVGLLLVGVRRRRR